MRWRRRWARLWPRAPRAPHERAACRKSHGRGRDLVLLHGWGTEPRVWDELHAALARRFRVIAVDLPGHGRSGWHPRATTPAAQAWRVHETLAPLTTRYSLLGWSLGGQFALDLAAAMPGAIERLVLVATTPKFLAARGWRHGLKAAALDELAVRLRADPAQALAISCDLRCAASPAHRRARAGAAASRRSHARQCAPRSAACGPAQAAGRRPAGAAGRGAGAGAGDRRCRDRITARARPRARLLPRCRVAAADARAMQRTCRSCRTRESASLVRRLPGG